MKLKHLLLLPSLGLMLVACNGKKSHYRITKVEKERITIDSRFDNEILAKARAALEPYKAELDSIMGQVVGKTKKVLEKGKPESTLSNLLADILVDAGPDYKEKPVIGVYNMGGIRTNSIPGGIVTWGDILSVAPFENNKICFLTLSGVNLMELFENIARKGGEGVSKGVALKITKDGKLLSAKFNGKPIDPKASYRIATIGYLAEGNDKLVAFTKKTNFVNPTGKENDTRFIIRKYFEKKAKAGVLVDANIEGRIVVVK